MIIIDVYVLIEDDDDYDYNDYNNKNNNYSEIYNIRKQEILSYNNVPYYLLLTSVLISFSSFIPLGYLSVNGSKLSSSMTSPLYGDSLLASILSSIPLFLTLIADYRNFFPNNNTKKQSNVNDVEIESKKRLWLSQAVIVVAVFTPGVYLYNAFVNKRTPAETYISFVFFKLYNGFGCNIFILSSFKPKIFTAARSLMMSLCFWISRSLLLASLGSTNALPLQISNNVFLVASELILFVLMSLCVIEFATIMISKNPSIDLLPEEYVALFYLVAFVFLFVAPSVAVFVYHGEELPNSNSTLISVYEYVTGIYTFLIVILPCRLSNLQITHASHVLRGIEHEDALNAELWRQRLPPKIADAVLSGDKSDINPEIYDNVTIFSSNVIDFDRKTMRLDPVNVVNILNDLYFVMDYCLLKFNLYKLDIIGDVYVCVAGVTSKNTAHENAALIADFALLVKECVKLIKFPKSSDPVRLTIGINSGRSTGAVVGISLPRFCLFGNAINIANFIEISGQNDYINCSSTTAKLLREHGQHVIEEGSGIVARDKTRKTYVITDITSSNTRLTQDFIRSVRIDAKKALKLSAADRKI